MDNFKAVIFDFDGVIVDTVAMHESCWIEVAKLHGFSFSHEQFLQGVGVKNDDFIREILGWSNDPVELLKEKEELFQNKFSEISLVDGLLPFLEALQNKKVPCAIASASNAAYIQRILDQFKIAHYFSHIVSGDDVQKGKPAPDLFLRAAAKLEQIPTECLVFEDAILGVEAANRANMKTVALTTLFSREQFAGVMPFKIISDFTEAEEIDEWFT